MEWKRTKSNCLSHHFDAYANIFGRKSFAHQPTSVTWYFRGDIRSSVYHHTHSICCALFFLLELIFFYCNFYAFLFISNWAQSDLNTKMTSFFKDEFDIYRKMLFRESHKSGAGLSVLNKFVCVFFLCTFRMFFSSVMKFTEIFLSKLKQNRNDDFSIRYKKFAIRFQTPTINMTFNGIFDCCRFVARFWNHLMQISKFWCHHLMKAFSMRWCKVHRTLCACASRIGWVTCRRIKLVIHSRDMSRMCCKVIKNCVLSKIFPG